MLHVIAGSVRRQVSIICKIDYAAVGPEFLCSRPAGLFAGAECRNVANCQADFKLGSLALQRPNNGNLWLLNLGSRGTGRPGLVRCGPCQRTTPDVLMMLLYMARIDIKAPTRTPHPQKKERGIQQMPYGSFVELVCLRWSDKANVESCISIHGLPVWVDRALMMPMMLSRAASIIDIIALPFIC